MFHVPIPPVLSDGSFYEFWFSSAPYALRDFFCSMTGIPRGQLLYIELLNVSDCVSLFEESGLSIRYRLENGPACSLNVYFSPKSLPPLPHPLPACLTRRLSRQSFLFISPKFPFLSLPCCYSECFSKDGDLLRVFSPKDFLKSSCFPLKDPSLFFWRSLLTLSSPGDLSLLSRRFPLKKEILQSFRDALSFFPMS